MQTSGPCRRSQFFSSAPINQKKASISQPVTIPIPHLPILSKTVNSNTEEINDFLVLFSIESLTYFKTHPTAPGFIVKVYIHLEVKVRSSKFLQSFLLRVE
ncbi:uncharacterized protein LOC123898066 [Trifolium pratense]|uniref:uncharacterized protein LOC123898066 n=1 Tax=Trifolium pratense TaxID=57577 RepID=UPI001E697FC7|nr:uncharacterized protein LOC123898066 [Trifolium pratense]